MLQNAAGLMKNCQMNNGIGYNGTGERLVQLEKFVNQRKV